MEETNVTFADEQSPQDNLEEREDDNNNTTTTFDNTKKLGDPRTRVDIHGIISFVFPNELQHPLAAARLFVYADYGPLALDGTLRSGRGGEHILSVWELDCMCDQVEREDLIQIFLHRGRDMGMLSKKEQQAIIGQADGHLKRAKGKAMLPQITPGDIYEILSSIQQGDDGKLSFHEVQKALLQFRKNRIKEYKLVFPSLKKPSQIKDDISRTIKSKSKRRQARVSSVVAPPSMFIHDDGKSNVEVVDQTNEYLSMYASKLNELDSQNDINVVSNVRLLRTVEPRYHNPYVRKKTGKLIKPEFNTATLSKGTSLGSKVKSARSSSTWQQKVTIY